MNLICAILLQVQILNGGLEKLISDFLVKPGQEAVNISVSIRSEANGKEIFAYQSALNMHPASTQKLITTATALEYLSPSYKFETMIYSNGRVINGKVNGDVYLEGVGDPSFGSTRFKEDVFSQVLKVFRDNEISEVEGRLKIENNDQSNFPLDWLVGDLGNYYGAFSNNFNFNENLYTVYFKGGVKVGDPSGISRIYPFDAEWKILNQVKTGPAGSGDQVNILNLPNSNDIIMVGSVPLGVENFAVKGAIPNVNKIFTDSLSTYLIKNGIIIHEKLFPENLQNEELGSVISPDIFTISKETNFHSVNIFADGLANFMWQADAPDFDSFLKSYWKEKGVNLQNQKFIDGSGLSPMNLVSTRSMTALLYEVKGVNSFKNTIPVLGKDGTVTSLGKNTGGRIKAKSGSIMGVRNYAGYFTSNNGKKYTFAIFVNGLNGEQNTELRLFFDNFFNKIISINL